IFLILCLCLLWVDSFALLVPIDLLLFKIYSSTAIAEMPYCVQLLFSFKCLNYILYVRNCIFTFRFISSNKKVVTSIIIKQNDLIHFLIFFIIVFCVKFKPF